jgi:5-methylcytosine-specific restriction enzyme subunit McrC
VKIPILNIYHLLLYAWDALDEGELVRVDAEPSTRLADLFGHVLAGGTAHLIRRGLDRDYLAHREEIPGVRGKIDVAATIKTAALTRAHAVCEFDEFSYDVPHNRILKSTLRNLLAVPELDPVVAARLLEVYRRMPEVSEIRISTRSFRAVQLHRNTGYYRFLLSVCLLVHEQLRVDERTGEAEFRDFARDEPAMRRLFERFIRNFYNRHAHGFRVKAEKFRWQQVTGGKADRQRLPVMITDTSLISPDRRLVIETKFVPQALVAGPGGGDPKVRSSHLYQLYAYLMNLSVRHRMPVEGVLLYPFTQEHVDLAFEVQGHRLRVRTVDLNQPWPRIEADLLTLIPTLRIEHAGGRGTGSSQPLAVE